jgi:hypothetical protein
MINNSNENYLMDDANSPELDKKLIGRVTEDFIVVCDHLKEASYQIRSKNESAFPIFVLSYEDVSLGVPYLLASDMNTKFHYSISAIEEFVNRDLVGEDSVAFFRENYKDPDEYSCLFVVDGQFAGFMYIPYPND